MANVRDKVWIRMEDGERHRAVVTKTYPDSKVVDVVVYADEPDDSNTSHSVIVGGFPSVKLATSAEEQKLTHRWWPAS